MKIVVDTNIVFSAILNTNGNIGELLLNSPHVFDFYSVTFLRLEINKYQDKLIKTSGLSEEKINELKYQIFDQIHFITEDQIPFEIWIKSINYVRGVDMDDIAFVALSEYLDIKLWTGDKKLMKGLLSKGFQKCISTQELLMLRDELEK